MDYILLRSRRKTLAVAVCGDGMVEVRAPLSLPASVIEDYLDAKRGWIERHVARQIAQDAARRSFSVGYGDWLPLCGREYPIRAQVGRAGFDGICFHLPPDLDGEAIRRELVGVYRAAARHHLTGRVAALAPRLGVLPAAVTITSAKTRWGSCSGKNRLSFSWRLMMADDESIDYVVLHELAHIKQHNHSARFWAEVAQYCPNYAELRGRLRALQERLARQGWE